MIPVKQCLLKLGPVCPVSLSLELILVLLFVNMTVCIGKKWFQRYVKFENIHNHINRVFHKSMISIPHDKTVLIYLLESVGMKIYTSFEHKG